MTFELFYICTYFNPDIGQWHHLTELFCFKTCFVAWNYQNIPGHQFFKHYVDIVTITYFKWRVQMAEAKGPNNMSLTSTNDSSFPTFNFSMKASNPFIMNEGLGKTYIWKERKSKEIPSCFVWEMSQCIKLIFQRGKSLYKKEAKSNRLLKRWGKKSSLRRFSWLAGSRKKKFCTV